MRRATPTTHSGRLLVAALLALAALLGSQRAARAVAPFPPAGLDAFDSEMSVVLSVQGSPTPSVIDLTGPVAVLRGAPVPGSGPTPCAIETELVQMDLVGTDPTFGTVRVRLDPERSSVGRVTAQGAACQHPASSFFDVFVVVEADTLPFQLQNLQPFRVAAQNLPRLPPLFDTYTHPPPSVPLVQVGNPGAGPVASIAGESTHRPVQDPTFSVAPGGPSGLDAADLLGIGNPPPTRISRVNLGLQAGDDLDALSYGLDVIDEPGVTTIAFSVDPASDGAPNSGVDREASKIPAEAHGDEFVSHFNGTNVELVDEGVLVLRSDQGGDDLEALTNQPARAVDVTGDGVPDRPVFFSLAPGSPTLAGLAASPADILVSGPGAASIFANASEIGLVAGDDVDAICLMKAGLPSPVLRYGFGAPGVPPAGNALTDWIVFSLAPGSPSLATLGVSPADLLVSKFAFAAVVWAEETQIGLLASDNLDALKCLTPASLFEIGGVPVTGGLVFVGIGYYGQSGDPFASRTDLFDFWGTRDPQTGHRDGPFALPEAPDDAGLETLDPALQAWSGGDNCCCFHKHGSFAGHGDQNPTACGHGVYEPRSGALVSIAPGDSPHTVARNIAEAIRANGSSEALRVTADWKVAEPVVTLAAVAGGLGAAGAPGERAVLVVTGTGPSRIELETLDADGLVIGPALTTLPVPVPEPAAGLGGLLALATARLAARGRRRG